MNQKKKARQKYCKNVLHNLKVKHLLLLLPIFFLFNFIVVSSNTSMQKVDPNSGILTDERDGQSYKWVRLKDGKKWMSENLNYKTEDSSCFEEKDSNCVKYGRLYNWQAASTACPKGWRLPSNKEWFAMVDFYGGVYAHGGAYDKYKTVPEVGKLAYESLIEGGVSGFDAIFGGRRDYNDDFNRFETHGAYWSRSIKRYDKSADWAYTFTTKGNKIYRSWEWKKFRFSCRCVQD